MDGEPKGLEGGADDTWYHDDVEGELDDAWQEMATRIINESSGGEVQNGNDA